MCELTFPGFVDGFEFLLRLVNSSRLKEGGADLDQQRTCTDLRQTYLRPVVFIYAGYVSPYSVGL